MNTRCSPRQLAIDLQDRSPCLNIRVGAVIVDSSGKIFAWGWNGPGYDGLGLCAERHAISRSNKKRLGNATMFVASKRVRGGRFVFSKPCERCVPILKNFGIKHAEFITKFGQWEKVSL